MAKNLNQLTVTGLAVAGRLHHRTGEGAAQYRTTWQRNILYHICKETCS